MDLAARLLDHLQQVVRDRDPYFSTEGHFYTREYVRQQLGEWGAVVTQEFLVKGQTHQNLILNLPGQDPSKSQRPLLIAAHYDAVPNCPGADDNASGVAALLELARLFAHQPARYPVRLIAFDMEEYGMLGSQHYAAEMRRSQESLRLMLSLEMLGYVDHQPGSQKYPSILDKFYPDRGDFIALIGNLKVIPELLHLSHHIKQAGIPCEWLPAGMRGMIVPQTRLSDHSPFWDQGYPALMVTDTSFMRNPHFHKASDRIETLDLNFMAGICQGLFKGLGCL